MTKGICIISAALVGSISSSALASGMLVDVRLNKTVDNGFSWPAVAYQFATHSPEGGARLHFKDGVYNYGPPSTSPVEALSVSSQGASARAYADLRRGKLGVSVATDADTRAYAQAVMDETLSFTIAGATAQTVTPLRMIVSVHAATADTGAYFFFQSGAGRLEQAGALDTPYYSANQGWSSFSTYMTGTTRLFDVTYNLLGATPGVALRLDLRAGAERGGAADLGNTAGIRFELPSSVSFSSSSGQFLAAVPEPASWALMLGGFGLLGAAVRRRRTRPFTLVSA
jgi:hypothetical protein